MNKWSSYIATRGQVRTGFRYRFIGGLQDWLIVLYDFFEKEDDYERGL
jgi:hypothetical protein